MDELLEKINELTGSVTDSSAITLKEYCENVVEYKKLMDQKLKEILYDEHLTKYTGASIGRAKKFDDGDLNITINMEKNNGAEIHPVSIYREKDQLSISDLEIFDYKKTIDGLIDLVEQNYNYYNCRRFNEIRNDDDCYFQIQNPEMSEKGLTHMLFLMQIENQIYYIHPSIEENKLKYLVSNKDKSIELTGDVAESFVDNIYIANEQLPDFMKDYLEIKSKKLQRKKRWAS